MNLPEEIKKIDQSKNPQSRGKQFEVFLIHMLEQEGLTVTLNPVTAAPRQTDLLAQYEQTFFIIEAKWTRKKTGIADIASIVDRLNRVSPDVFGCVFSIAGFTEAAIEDAAARRSEKEIVLFNGHEIRGIVDGRASFLELLKEKRELLRRYGRTYVAENEFADPPIYHLRTAPDVFRIGGQQRDWMLSKTNGDEVIFSNEILDCFDLRGNSLFSLELNLELQELSDLRRVLDLLKTYLNLSGQGSFAIHQSEVGWFGFGIGNFLSAVKQQGARYDELKWERYHHSEELAYLDRLDGGGLVCLASRQGVGSRQSLHSTHVEIYLPGLPVDMSALRHVCKLTKNEAARLEIVDWNPLQKIGFRPRIRVEPVATIISKDLNKLFASGLAVRNPFLKTPFPPDDAESKESVSEIQLMIRSSDLLCCDMRHWHSPERQMDRYEIGSIQGLWIAHWYALHVSCDWPQR